MSVSPDVVILTVRELDDMRRAEFQRGVERGRFEEGAKHNALSVLREVEVERHLEAGNTTLDRIYAAAREAHLIGPHDGAEELLRAIRRIQEDN